MSSTVELYLQMRRKRLLGQRWTVIDTYKSLPKASRDGYVDGLGKLMDLMAAREVDYVEREAIRATYQRGLCGALWAYARGEP